MKDNGTQSSKETPAEQTQRLLAKAKAELDQMANDALKDPKYFGRPSVELVVQAGTISAINVNRQQSIK